MKKIARQAQSKISRDIRGVIQPRFINLTISGEDISSMSGEDCEDFCLQIREFNKKAEFTRLSRSQLEVRVYVRGGKKFVERSTEIIRNISKLIPDKSEIKIYPELVTISEIAHRVRISQSSVLSWTKMEGKDSFPEPYFGDEEDSRKRWAWSEVVDWIERTWGINFDENVVNIWQLMEIQHLVFKEEWENGSEDALPHP